MPEVEDVARPSAGAREDLVGRRENAVERAEQERGVEISLDAAVAADSRPGFVERRAPVGADHVAAGLAQLIEDRSGADAEMNRRHAGRGDAGKDFPGVRQDELAVVGGVQRADPRIEHLHAVDAGFDLRDEIVADDVCDQIAEAVPGGGVAVHQRLGVREVVRVAAFDRIGRERERRAGESNQRHAPAERLLDLPNGVEDVAQLFARLEGPGSRQVGFGAQRVLDRRPFAPDEIEGDTHRLERQQ